MIEAEQLAPPPEEIHINIAEPTGPTKGQLKKSMWYMKKSKYRFLLFEHKRRLDTLFEATNKEIEEIRKNQATVLDMINPYRTNYGESQYTTATKKFFEAQVIAAHDYYRERKIDMMKKVRALVVDEATNPDRLLTSFCVERLLINSGFKYKDDCDKFIRTRKGSMQIYKETFYIDENNLINYSVTFSTLFDDATIYCSRDIIDQLVDKVMSSREPTYKNLVTILGVKVF